MRRRLLLGALAVAPALALPATAGAAATCAYDPATATVQVQMLSARTVLSRGPGGQLAADGRACGALATIEQVIVASAYLPAADTVIVDERRGRLADPATGSRPTIYALTGLGGDTMEVIGTPGTDRYTSYDDLGASIDLDGDGDPDFLSTDAGRIVLRGGGGHDHIRRHA
jgi:hypothetical protein